MADLFEDTLMTLTDSAGNIIKPNLPVQVDTVNIPINMEVERDVPTDWFDVYSIGWVSPVPVRGNLFVDQSTGRTYTVFGRTAVYADHLEVRIALPLGTTP